MLKTISCALAIVFMSLSSPAKASSTYQDLFTAAHKELSGLFLKELAM